MNAIEEVDAWEVLDSRGNPTVRVRIRAGDAEGTFTVPAGASTGKYEAVERRDGGDRFGGLGVRDAVDAVTDDLATVVEGRDVTEQAAIDAELVEADGTEDLSRLGANAVLGVSGAVARTAAEAVGEPLYAYLGDGNPGRLPLPLIQILAGGLHAEGGIEIQDFQIVPIGAESYSQTLEQTWDVRQTVKERLLADGHQALIGDEGGFGLPLESIDAAFELVMTGIREAGYVPGDDFGLGLDVAATHFYTEGRYELDSLGQSFEPVEMVDLVSEWVAKYPIVSVEDPLVEDDWDAWARLVDSLGEDTQILGDDLLVTNEDRVERAIESEAATAVLVKPNQTGTISRAMSVVQTAQEAGLGTVVSARSGETCDSTIADLAVGLDAEQIKICSIAGSERLSKYNRLLEIEREMSDFAGDSALSS